MADAMKLLLEEARDLLLERRHGNPARSAGHNARLVIEEALKIAASPPAREEAPAEGAGDLYERAKVFATRDKPSTSYLQRRLQIGYNQAAELIERMESEGLISRRNHAGMRTILVPYLGRLAPSARDRRPMTDTEIRQWIDACNHEPGRQVLRDYLALRNRTSEPEAGAVK